MKLTRYSRDPVLKTVPEHKWERAAVFNAGAVYENGLYHMIYRATDIGGHESFGDYINNLGYAWSENIIDWQRLPEPILKNDVPQELRGPEDPRIVKLEGRFFMTYTGFGGRYQGDYRICLAISEDLKSWERQGVLLHDENKNAAFFPQKFGNEYLLLHRRGGNNIWISSTKDLKNYTKHTSLMGPLPGGWEERKIGIAGPPVLHPEGWLLIYHGVDMNYQYRLGAALLDRENPRRVLARYSQPIIESEEDWERQGPVPNVIFSCATIDKDDRYDIIYAGADSLIGAAYILKSDVVFEKEHWL
ncbi:MAG: glycosidase [Candidatus Marinimicrobia bacterium]|nr:glycosidase [Candidatus Neomarinimicrobiota bacterium]